MSFFNTKLLDDTITFRHHQQHVKLFDNRYIDIIRLHLEIQILVNMYLLITKIYHLTKTQKDKRWKNNDGQNNSWY